MSLSTTQYGYIVDPMVPFTDDKGKTIKNGFIRVFMAGTSTPVLTYRNYDGATNEEKIELDNSGRVKHNVIGSKGSLYKVVVYDAHHSQETPILTVDKITVLGASINASGSTIVTGLDTVTVQEENFLKATVEGTGVELALDPTEVTSEVSTTADAVTAASDYVVPLLDKTGTGDGKKISLANFFNFTLDWISRLATTITSFASGDFIAVSNTTDGTRKITPANLATWIHNKWAAFVNALTSKTSFANGDKIPVVNGSTATAMEASKLMELTAQKGFKYINGDILNGVISFVGEGDTFVHAVSKMPVVAGQELTIKFPYAWAYSMADPTKRKFEVMFFADSLTTGQLLYECTVNQSLPTEINIKVPLTATSDSYIRIGGRGPTDQQINVFYLSNKVSLFKNYNNGYNDYIGEFYEKDNAVKGVYATGYSRNVKIAGLPNAVIGCVLTTTGSLSTSANGAVTIAYYPVSPGDKVTFYCGDAGAAYNLITYDSVKDYVGYYAGQVNARTITVASGVSYIRMSFVNSSDEAFVSVNGKTVFTPALRTIANEITKHGALVPIGIIGMNKGFSRSPNKIKVLPNHKYRLHIPFPSSYHSGDNTQYKVEIEYYASETAPKSVLKYWTMNQTVPSTYDFNVPASATVDSFVTCGGREAYGNMLTLYLEDITSTYNDPWNDIVNNATPDILALCKKGYGNANAKNYVFAVTTDSHGSTDSVKDVIALSNKQDCIDAVFNFGDITRTNYNDTDSKSAFFAAVNDSTKPVLPVIGNHDVGLGYYVGYGCNHQQAYTDFIKPVVDKSWISANNKCYYYKDFPTYKLRVIAVYEYDSDLEIDETKWSLVTYDSSKPMISTSATYQQGDVVNVPNFTDYSFSANETIDMTGASVWNKDKYPSYKFQRGYRMIRQTQAEWLCNTLISTPQDYSVIILLHNPFSSVAVTDPTKLFCKNVSTTAAASIQSVMDTDILAEIVNAFNNGLALNINVKYKGDATYANTLTDGQGNSYAYNLSADFSQKNSGVKFLCYFGGHTHWDAIWKHPTYTDQMQVTSMEQGFQELTASDIPKDSNSIGTGGGDSILVVGIDETNNQISLAKIGNQRTIDGRLRDFDVINV